jgi:hypothetical protein
MDIKSAYDSGLPFELGGVDFDIYAINARGEPEQCVWGQIGDYEGDGGYLFMIQENGEFSVWLNGVEEVRFQAFGVDDAEELIKKEIDIRRHRL